MSRTPKVVSALLLCISLVQLSESFPASRCCCDSVPVYEVLYDDCCECGFIRLPDEPLLPLHVIQGGPGCCRCKPLPYQVQVPLPPPALPCGQQYGFRVEVPAPPCAPPCLNVGYEVEVPCAPPCAPKLPPLPISVTVPACSPKPCSYNIAYEVESPVAPCAPRLANLKTQVDRVVLPCPCSPPIHNDGYVPPAPPERRKRSACWQCDCGQESDEDTDDFMDDQSSSRSRWRNRFPRSQRREISTRTQYFPASRFDQSPRRSWLVERVQRNDVEDTQDSNEEGDDPVTTRPATTSQNSEQRIVSRGLPPIAPTDYDYDSDPPQSGEGPPLSEDPIGNRRSDPSFGNMQQSSRDDAGENRTLIDSLLGTVRSDPQRSGGRVQASRGFQRRGPGAQTSSGQNRGMMNRGPSRQGSSQRGSSGQANPQETRATTPQPNRRRQGESQDRVTTPNTYRSGQGGSRRQGTGEQDRITTPNTERQGGDQMQRSSQNQSRITNTPDDDQMQERSQNQSRITNRQGGDQSQRSSPSQSRVTNRQGGDQSQRTSPSQSRVTNRRGGSQRQGNPQHRITTPNTSQDENRNKPQRPNQQRPPPQQSPTNPQRPNKKRPNRCNVCADKYDFHGPTYPDLFAPQTPDDSVTYVEYNYVDYPSEGAPGPFARLTRPSASRRSSASTQAPPSQPPGGPGGPRASSPGRNQQTTTTTTTTAAAPQVDGPTPASSSTDTSRIVSPNTYDESRTNYPDYDFDYYYDY